MAQEKTTTMADSNVSKVTALPEGCTLALFDSSGGVSKIDAQKFMELVRGSIQIGGRNLIPNSKQISVAATSKDYSYVRIRENLNVKTGDLLTASVGSIKGTGAQEQIAFLSIYNQLTNITIARFVLKPDAKSATSTVSADCDNAQVLLYPGIPGDNAGKSLEVTELKLERGNIATDWMPAPEDFGGGVKSPYTQLVTRLYLRQQLKPLTIQRKGGRHERRQNNRADRGYIAFASAECSDKAGRYRFGFGFEYGHSARLLSDSNLGYRESSRKHDEICNTRGSSRILSGAHDYPDTKSLPSHSFANKRRKRCVVKVDEVFRRISLIPGKEVVAA